jgi:hypothetical protein
MRRDNAKVFLEGIDGIDKMFGLYISKQSNPDNPVNPLSPLILCKGRFGPGSKATAERSECEARKHEAEEAGKASLLGFTAWAALCGF